MDTRRHRRRGKPRARQGRRFGSDAPGLAPCEQRRSPRPRSGGRGSWRFDTGIAASAACAGAVRRRPHRVGSGPRCRARSRAGPPHAPQPVPDARDLHRDLVQASFTPGLRQTTAGPIGEGPAELEAPPAHGLAADDHAASRHKLVHVAQAEREAEAEPHRVADHPGREAVAGVAGGRQASSSLPPIRPARRQQAADPTVPPGARPGRRETCGPASRSGTGERLEQKARRLMD